MKRDTAVLDRLIDELKETEASERNQARARSDARPRINIEMEDPIAWIRLFGYDPEPYFNDPLFNLEQQIRQKLWKFRNFEDDIPLTSHIPAWLGHYPEYTFFGMDVGVQEHGGPDIQTDHPMTRDANVGMLEPVDFRASGWMPRMLRWYEDLAELADGRLEVSFFAWNRGNLDLAVQLRGYENLLMDCLETPEFVHELMIFLTRQRNAWHDARAEHLGTGIGPTWVADDWVAVPYISPKIFGEFVLPRYLEIEAHHGVFGGFHSCGDQRPLHADMLKIETLNSYEVSPWMDVETAMESLPPDKHVHIAVHPNDVVVDSAAAMAAKHKAKAEALKDSGRSFALGTSGLTPLQDEAEFVGRVNAWIEAARQAFA
ncbi:MAG TPA: uroporphyrinogen decarboxylase family protein [Armatimonadota bacterium]|nr:uroporphyrinogen decarboxylase family protein [Armatimonadota bacterium]